MSNTEERDRYLRAISFGGAEPSEPGFAPVLGGGSARRPVRTVFDAARQGRVSAFGRLVREGADLEAVDEGTGLTVLQTAILYGQFEVVEYLAGEGVDLNRPGEPLEGDAARGKQAVLAPLTLARREGHPQIARFLLQRGARDPARARQHPAGCLPVLLAGGVLAMGGGGWLVRVLVF